MALKYLRYDAAADAYYGQYGQIPAEDVQRLTGGARIKFIADANCPPGQIFCLGGPAGPKWVEPPGIPPELREQLAQQFYGAGEPPSLELNGLKNIVNSTTETHMPDYSVHRPACEAAPMIHPTPELQAQAHRDEARKIEKCIKAANKATKAETKRHAEREAQRETIRLGLLDVLNDKTRGYARVEAARTLLENF